MDANTALLALIAALSAARVALAWHAGRSAAPIFSKPCQACALPVPAKARRCPHCTSTLAV